MATRSDLFQDALGGMLNRISNCLIGATPDAWERALLEVERGLDGAVSSAIRSPEGRCEQVVPTRELATEIQNLLNVYAAHDEALWRLMVLEVLQEPSGGWRFRVDFRFDD
jgi:hypothetical protein